MGKENLHFNASVFGDFLTHVLSCFGNTNMTRILSDWLATPMVVAVFLLSAPLAPAADWSDAAFPVKSHNFGTVAVAAKTEFRFPINNNFSSDMHIRSVRASCGCTTPIVETPFIAPGSTGNILARFNTKTFKGKRGATLTVVIDRPFYSEVRLRVDGYIRSDMVFHPGAVEFGKLNQGDPAAKTTRLLYAGRSDWKVLDIESNRPWLMPSFEQTLRGSGRVDYQIKISVREDAPTGYFQDEVIVVTNDRSMPRVPLRVSGSVESALSIAPQSIALGSLKPGQSIKQKMIVRGREPFLIESLTCEGWEVEFAPTTVAKTTHVLFPEFTPTETAAGPQKVSIVITTAGDESVTAKALLTADVRDR